MLRDGWNFHNDIAYNFEKLARNHYKWADRPYNTIFDSDSIEGGTFVECIIIILREVVEYKIDNTEIEDFINECEQYIGIRGNQIDCNVANKLFLRFKELYNKYNNY